MPVRQLPAILICGAARHSLGEAVVRSLRSKHPDNPIIIIDKESCPILDEIENAKLITIDLNPLTRSNSYDRLAAELNQVLKRARRKLGFPGVGLLILAAGTYDCGSLANTSIEARKRLIGVNVCGKLEMIHAVLMLNKSLGFLNSESLSLVDIGSLHGIFPAADRSLYGATKAMGLGLCASLHLGGELKRVIHLAPTAIDTYMLHRNHWVSKEGGSVQFIEKLKNQPNFYAGIFVSCDDTIFSRAIRSRRTDRKQLLDLFQRYKKRRRDQFAHRYGVLGATQLAAKIVEILDRANSDGVYIITAQNRKIRTRRMNFSELKSG